MKQRPLVKIQRNPEAINPVIAGDYSYGVFVQYMVDDTKAVQFVMVIRNPVPLDVDEDLRGIFDCHGLAVSQDMRLVGASPPHPILSQGSRAFLMFLPDHIGEDITGLKSYALQRKRVGLWEDSTAIEESANGLLAEQDITDPAFGKLIAKSFREAILEARRELRKGPNHESG